MDFQTIIGSMLLQTTLVLSVAFLVVLLVLRISGCRRPWVHQILWGGVLLLGLVGMRIPFVVPVEVETPHEPISVAAAVSPETLDVLPDQTEFPVFAMNSTSEEPRTEQPEDDTSERFRTIFMPRFEEEISQSISIIPITLVEEIPATKNHFDRVSVWTTATAILLFAWFFIVAVKLIFGFIRYFRLLWLLRKAEEPDKETENLWSKILDYYEVSEKNRPRIKILPEGGPAMIRTPLWYTLVLSKSHWNELDTPLRLGVMRHELAHFLYGDLWKTLFAKLITLLHWFNPLAHLAARRFEEAVEWSADSFSYGSEEKGLEHFAAAMLLLHETTPQNYRYNVAFGTKNILRRLEFLKRLKNGSKESLVKTGIVLGFSLLLLALGAINIRIVAQEKKAQTQTETVQKPQAEDRSEIHETVQRGTVMTPDGKPAADATVLVASGNLIYYVSPDRFDENCLQTKTDQNGKFTLPPIPLENNDKKSAKFDLVLIHEEGCLLLCGEEFEKNHNTEARAITLEPWGQLEGVFSVSNQPSEDVNLNIERQVDMGHPRFRSTALATTGKGGTFSVPKLFPGKYLVSKNTITQRLGDSTRATRVIAKPVVIESGKKAEIQLGGTGRPVVGRVITSPKMDRLPQNSKLLVQIRTPPPQNPELPPYPMEERKRFLSENDQEDMDKLEKAWLLTDAGKKYQADLEEFQKKIIANDQEAYRNPGPSFGAIGKSDGTFRVENVESGRWVWSASLYDGKANQIARAERILTIPAGGQSDEPFDFGTVIFQNVKPTLPPPAKTEESPMTLTVLDTNGQPIVGATGYAGRVDKNAKRPGKNFTTDENGRVEIERTTPENAAWFCFNIKTAGYEPFFGVWEADSSEKYPPDEFTVKLAKARTLGGRVLDPDGKPVEGVVVDFSFPYGKNSFNDDDTYCAASGKTDADGWWTCPYVPESVEGKLTFYMSHPDFQSTYTEVDVAELKPDGSHVFTIQLQHGYEIHGTVRDENGAPIADAKVGIQFFDVPGTEKEMCRRTTTDAQGHYRFTTCPLADSTGVIVQAPGFAGKYVETSVGSVPKAVDFVLGPSKPLKLRIEDEKGNAINDFYITASRWGPFDGFSISLLSRMLRADNYEPLKLDDGHGNWVWKDALSGNFQISVGANGFMLQQYVDVKAGDVKTIVMKPELQVDGTVVDDETGQPIPAFRLVQGFGNVTPGYVAWQTYRIREEKNGSFRYTSDRPQKYGRQLRVEADGYENCESRTIENDEGAIALVFRMKRAVAGISEKAPGKKVDDTVRRGTVLTPDGKPAADANVLVSWRLHGIYVTLGYIENHLQAKTDQQGKFTLPPIPIENNDEKPAKFDLVLMHEDGCLYLTGEDFEKNHDTAIRAEAKVISLQPWAQLEGVFFVGSEPSEGAPLRISRQRDQEHPGFSFDTQVTTGKGGLFSLEKLFPGEYSVAKNTVVWRSGGSTRYVGGIDKNVEIASGQKMQIKLGGTGRPVVGHVMISPEMDRLPPNAYLSVQIHAPRPPYPAPPQAPKPKKQYRSFEEWMQSEECKKYQTETEAYQKELFAISKKARQNPGISFGTAAKPDGAFRIEDVESGNWVLSAVVYDEESKRIAEAEHPLTIPKIPGGRSDEPFDAGTIIMKNDKPKVNQEAKIEESPITLLVLDSQEKPIARAEVELRTYPKVEFELLWGKLLQSQGGSRTLQTDEHGRLRFTLPKELPKSLEFLLNIDGHAPAWLRWESISSRDDLPKVYTLKLDAAQSVGGILVNEDGQPIEGAVIRPDVRPIQRPEDKQPAAGGRECTTDAQGRWIFRSIPASYSSLGLEIKHPQYMAFVPTISTATYSVPKGADAERKLVLPQGRTITGTIIDEKEKPIAGAFVRTKFMNDYREVVSNENGAYRLPGIPVGEMNLLVGAKGCSPQIRQLNVKPDSPQELSENFELQPGGTIRVRLEDEQGKPIPDAEVSLKEWKKVDINWSSQNYPFGLNIENNKTDENGVWVWNEAPADEVRVAIYPDGFVWLSETLYPREREFVFVPKSPRPRTAEEKPAVKTFSSTVFLPGDTNEPASLARVYLLDENSQAKIELGKMELELSGTGTDTDEQGRFTLPVWEKPFWLWALHEKGFARLEPGKFQSENGIKLTAWSRVEGTVYKGSKPAAGEKVFLNRFGEPEKYDSWGDKVPNFYLSYKTVSDENGRFSFDYVVPGSGTASRVIETLTAQKTNRGGGQYAYLEPFTVAPGETATVKVGGKGRPVIGKIDIKRNDIDCSQLILVTGFEAPHSLGAALESDGRFRIEDVPPGKHVLTLQNYEGMNPAPSFNVTFDAPEIPGGRSDEPLDLGTMNLHR